MVLTHPQRNQHPLDPFPTTQLFILAICRVAEPIALTSIFPYAWPMVREFNIGDKNNASFYAGILISSFSFSEALTGMFWGSLSDRIGRKPVMLLGCIGTMLSMLLMGFAKNFWLALLARALGGILNGNIGVIQTMVGELVHHPEHEPRAYAVMPFVWSIGTIIGPAIGGTLAKPAVTFPSLFSDSGIFATFPYLLPNLICALMLLVSILAGYFFLAETHPDMQPWSTPAELEHTTAHTPLIMTSGAMANDGVDLRADSYGTFNHVDITTDEKWENQLERLPESASISSQVARKLFTKRIVMLVVALGIFAYHSMTYDHLLPIFLQDEKTDGFTTLNSGVLNVPGGLGLTTQQVGVVMSINGVIALLVQAIVFPLVALWLGVWKTFLVVTILHPIAYFIVPFLALLPESLIYPGIYTCLTIRNICAILAYPVILILLKEACPKSGVLGTINGLAASAAAASRTAAPPLAGLLYGLGASQGFTGLAWWASGIVAIFGAIQLFWVEREKHQTAIVSSVAPLIIPKGEEREEVHVIDPGLADV